MTVVDPSSHAGVLSSLPAALRDDAVLTSLLGTVDGTIAVPEVARAVSVAALAELSGRRPIVVACPTSTLANPEARRR